MAETPSVTRTVTQTIESDLTVETVVGLLANPTHIPEWATAFADSVSGDTGSGWRVTKDGQTFALRVSTNDEAGTVDYLRQVAPGSEGGGYIRVIPRPRGGSVVVITVPLLPGVDPAEVAATLDRELEVLVSLGERP